MDKRFFGGIRFKMSLLFGLLFVALVFITELVRFYGVPFASFKGGRAAFKEEAFRNFSTVANLHKERILSWIEERKNNLLIMSVVLEEDLSRINELIQSYKGQGKSGSELWQALQKEAVYKKMLNYLVFRKEIYRVYHELKIMDSNGTTIISTELDNIGKKTFDNEFQPGKLNFGGFLFEVSFCHIYPNEADLVIIRLINTKGLTDNKADKAGVFLVGHISLEDILMPVIRSSSGLGETGEIVLVDSDRRVLMPLKYPLKDGRIAVPLKDKLSTLPATRAARGEEGVIESFDYKGELVLAAYRSVRISPHQRWGMVVKRERKEVFDFLERSVSYSTVINIIAMLLGLFLIFFVSGNLTRPIRKMAEAAKSVEDNNFTVRADETEKDEVGLLAAAFNKMMERIENWKTELETQVQRRTAELNAANQQLRASEQQLKAANQQLKASQQQLKAGNEQLVMNEKRLRAEMEHRESLEDETKRHLQELQIFFKASLGREERIVELKDKIKELEAEIKKK